MAEILRNTIYKNTERCLQRRFRIAAFSLPVVENVLMQKAEEGDRERVEEALRLAGVYDKVIAAEGYGYGFDEGI